VSEFHVRIVKIDKVDKHPNADTLSLTSVEGYPVVFRTGEFSEGDLAVYLPVDSVVPDTEQWAWLNGRRRVRAKRLRGIFSMGLLAPLPVTAVGLPIGINLQSLMQIEKWEPPVKLGFNTEAEACPFTFPEYSDLEGFRKYGHAIYTGEEVVVTEKLHGTNSRYVFKDGRLWAASHRVVRKDLPGSLYWEVAKSFDLANKLSKYPDLVFFGEIYGKGVQDLIYGENHVAWRCFDILDLNTQRYLNYTDFTAITSDLALPTVPVLYLGGWKNELAELRNGPSTLAGHIREGFVVKPIVERFNVEIGRVALKYVGEDYLLRKE
jgi:RNA ligase (TIGR02306 family)